VGTARSPESLSPRAGAGASGALATSTLGSELLDDPGADPHAVHDSLRHIERANRWFGGRSAALWGVCRALADAPRGTTLSLLDIGTGAGDLPRAAVDAAARRGVRLVPLGLERSRVAAAMTRAAGIPVLLGDAAALPIAPDSVDLILLSQVAHHFTPASAAALIGTCHRIARRAVIVSDLRRSRLATLAFSVGSRALRFDHVTHADGHTSIRRGYSRDELAAMLPPGAEIRRRPGWRLVAVSMVQR